MTRVSEYTTVAAVERELDRVLGDLRKVQSREPGNIMALGACEYRIGALRRRRATLQDAALAGRP